MNREDRLEKTPTEKLGKLLDVVGVFTHGKIEIDEKSLEILKNLKTPVIFAPTHMSDHDIAIFLELLAKETNIKAVVVQESSHDNFQKDPATYISIQIAKALTGEENFLNVSSDRGKGEFNPQDFPPMVKTIEKGKSLVIAAYHNRDKEYLAPSQYGAKLPPKGGDGAALVASLANVSVVPVAINIESKNKLASLIGRTKVKISIGKPIKPPEKINIKISEPINPEDIGVDPAQFETMKRRQYGKLFRKLQKYSNQIMSSINEMMPPEKRNEKINQSSNS